nr:type ISP restriction/modification enzyme [Leucobacter chromiireducens]
MRAASLDERDKGDRFERLIKSFLETDPEWQQRFSTVEFFTEWELNTGGKDIGIDLVAKNRYDEGWTAIQCKFYDSGAKVAKSAIDSFLSISYRPDFNFTQRFIIDTADGWSGNAEETLRGQVQRIDISMLDDVAIDWSGWSIDQPEKVLYAGPKTLRPHQREALADVRSGFGEHDRGKLIMACGTGKTFTSLKIAEELVGKGGRVLFLVPSIQLLSQSLREWMAQTTVGIRPFAVCSDVRVGRRDVNNDEQDQSTVDLTEPPTTDPKKLVARYKQNPAPDAMTVVFSTYQSIDVVIAAQEHGLDEFDLIICDEAHRTSGVSVRGEARLSHFLKVHDQDLLKAKKRLYMTATPRVFDDSVKRRADDAEAILFDMGDEKLYGPELHRLGFGKAVESNLLTDYKVLVLAVDEDYVAKHFQSQWGSEIPLDDIAKLVGCWNGLDKHFKETDDAIKDWRPMKTAVAFARDIASSKTATTVFPEVSKKINEAISEGDSRRPLAVESHHVDGTMGIHERNSKLAWLKEGTDEDVCRVLTNARCLSEGVDVPALDAVLFLTPRGSQVDVVQSVGRVMRLAPGKELGYIILPVVIPAGIPPEEALQDNERYRVVWQVLQALRSHDDRFNAEINKINLNRNRSPRISVISVTNPSDQDRGDGSDNSESGPRFQQQEFDFPEDEVIDAMYARIVQKVGERTYWAKWASEVATIAEKHITRIEGLLAHPYSKQAVEFKRFLKGLRGNLNENITEQEAVEMLAQHLITRPIFEKLFEGYDFTAHNPVAQVMEKMLEVLDEKNLDDENQTLRGFYESVGRRVDGVDNSDGKQKILIELYDNFFKAAFRRSQEKLGIVYSPTEIVDFILRSADAVLKEEFGQALTDENVHILDGFIGTGTFLVRLLQSGLIKPEDLPRKYANELHGNEILLLAYYIATVNLETTYQEITGDAQAFDGLILTDTFQSWEPNDVVDLEVFEENNKRLEALKKLKITVIVGNPPYSVGQDSANDNNANESYPALDSRIKSDYADRSAARHKASLLDSYIRAIKWASLRIQDCGVIAYVTNGGWIDSSSADGMRKSLADEFTSIYVWNLRGNQRTAGELSRKEGGKIFGGGSRATVAITLLVKNPTRQGQTVVNYAEVADYMTREEKLKLVADTSTILTLNTKQITPNTHGDWINQRRDDFIEFLPASSDDRSPSIFGFNTGCPLTSRDSWVYNSSQSTLQESVTAMIEHYNSLVPRYATHIAAGSRPQAFFDFSDVKDETKVSWDGKNKKDLAAGKIVAPKLEQVRSASYRPFFKQHLYYDSTWINSVYRIEETFPIGGLPNMGFYVVGKTSANPFSALMTNIVPDRHYTGAGSGGQFFPRFRYEKAGALSSGQGAFSFDEGTILDGYRQIDNITDDALSLFQAHYPSDTVSKDDVFFYVYGLLHSPEYRTTFEADLKKTLPHVPFVREFRRFADAGRALSELHLNYEAVERYPLAGLEVEPLATVDAYEFFAIEKAKFGGTGKKKDMSQLVYNRHITLSGIPEEVYRYMLGSRSAIEWLNDRYQVKVDAKSGIRNDPNDWSREVGDPRYILDLYARIVTVSVETMKILDSLPPLDIVE